MNEKNTTTARFAVQANSVFGGWETAWTTCDDAGNSIPLEFDSKEQAQAEIDEFFSDIQGEIDRGEREEDEGFDDAEFRIVCLTCGETG